MWQVIHFGRIGRRFVSQCGGSFGGLPMDGIMAAKLRQVIIFWFVFFWVSTAGCVSYGHVGVIETGIGGTAPPPSANELTLVTWNVAKNVAGNPEINRLVTDYSPDILMIQEGLSTYCDMFGPSFHQCLFAPSWKKTEPDIYTGVQILSRFRLENPIHVESPAREGFLFTPKTTLISLMDLPDGRSLMLINVHMLNFVPVSELENYLAEVRVYAGNHEGPLIIGGDFNTWSNARLKAVREFACSLGMVEADAVNEPGHEPFSWLFLLAPFLDDGRKSTLDRWFCRGFEVVACRKLSGFYSSDHVPVLLRVRVLPQ
jgi:endonuclease/exonuclease/phosphatase (EEP) superfamily protein YafD